MSLLHVSFFFPHSPFHSPVAGFWLRGALKGHELCAVFLLYVRGSGTLGILRPSFSLCVWLIMMSSLAHFSPLCTCTMQRGNEKSLPARKKAEFFSPRTPSSALEHKSVFAMQIRQSTVARAKKKSRQKARPFFSSFLPSHARTQRSFPPC